MKRTPPWVFVAAAMVQLAGLGLCVWAMERSIRDTEEDKPRPALAPPSPTPAAGFVFAPSSAQQAVQATPPRATPASAPPNGAARIPAFVADEAESSTQLWRGEIGGRSLIFAFYAGGKIKVVDVDGGRYHGMREGSRARMREVGGTRAFTIRFDEAGAGRLEVAFTGGAHDDATISLNEYVGRDIV